MPTVALAKEGFALKYVYLLRSLSFPDQKYVGLSSDVHKRLEEHNAGKSLHTSKFKPWELVLFTGFKDEGKAVLFEKYLKTGSGQAFAKRRFW